MMVIQTAIAKRAALERLARDHMDDICGVSREDPRETDQIHHEPHEEGQSEYEQEDRMPSQESHKGTLTNDPAFFRMGPLLLLGWYRTFWCLGFMDHLNHPNQSNEQEEKRDGQKNRLPQA